jgi:hypothetical protein
VTIDSTGLLPVMKLLEADSATTSANWIGAAPARWRG